MDTAYRLYLGARNIGSRSFSPDDLAAVEAILDEHFLGWTTTKAVGRWEGETEETLVITFTSQGLREAAPTVARSSAETAETGGAPETAIEACVRRLKAQLGQESVLLEEGGTVRVR